MLPLTLPLSILRASFSSLGKICQKRASLPVLGYLKFERLQNRLVITATDLDRWLTFTHQLEPPPLTALGRTMAEIRWKRDSGAILVPRPAVQAALRGIRHGELTISEGELHYAIAGEPVHVPFVGLPAETFPETPAVAVKGWSALDAMHRDWLAEALRFVSTDETRYVLNGVLCQSTPPAAIVGTDGRRLYLRETAALASGHDVILPTATVGILQTPALLAHEWRFGVAATADYAAFEAGPWRLVTKLIEGYYPNYRQVIPDTTHFASAKLTLETHHRLCEVLAKLPPPEPGKQCVTLRFYPDRLGIESASPKVSLAVLGICSDAPVISVFDRYFLLDALSLGPGTFRIVNAIEPMIYEAGGAIHILMPRRSEAGPGSIEDPELEAASARWLGKRASFSGPSLPELVEGEVTAIQRAGIRLLATLKTYVAVRSFPVVLLSEVSPEAEQPVARKPARRSRRTDLAAA